MKNHSKSYCQIPVDAAMIYPVYDDNQDEKIISNKLAQKMKTNILLTFKIFVLIVFLVLFIVIENSTKPFLALFQKDKLKEYSVVYVNLVLTFLFFIAMK